MTDKRVLTGVTTTGIPHLGNYVGAIRPAIAATQEAGVESFIFLADYHGLIKCHEPEKIHESTLAVAATWLACGLDPEHVTFYRQSDIPETMELNWIFNCICAKGLMNRAHAYKAAVQANVDAGQEDLDHGVEMGLYCYPVLMAADILIFNGTHVPVGRDQIQHLEMARDIAGRFNHRFKELFVMPEAVVDETTAILTGLDGRKMSKSYGNTIPLFEGEKKLRKSVMKIVTNSLEPGQPKEVDGSTLFEIYQAFATAEQQAAMKQAYADGIGWGDAKQQLFELINAELAEKRERFAELTANPSRIEDILQAGADKARKVAHEHLAQVREAVGIRVLK
ncbi:tryptophan--tRNA ligase [Vitreoscilla massiliensis]|uniref:Tryptophan--tRNA ligase n=1 Tax=Vitreoscilla massiliensis TaxID=1689272 RepID=A0ABY4E1F4_9NEIS|nr:tryptophan--tRNA ligase [Vitreoscilla massiliensis]UOO89324.1 tryptophan--tRNA ligase [Vitreoscilla massiliensis]